MQELSRSCDGKHSESVKCMTVDVLSEGPTLDEWASQVMNVHGRIDFAFLASGAELLCRPSRCHRTRSDFDTSWHVRACSEPAASLSIGVSCAGSSQAALAECTTHDVGVEVLRLNAEGSINIGRALLRRMRSQKSKSVLVPIASMAARVPSPGQAEYAAAKHAVLGYYRSLAYELPPGQPGVAVVCPGPIAGEVERSVYGPEGRTVKREDERQQRKKVSQERCMSLICRAAARGVAEAWIAKHPVLAMAYLSAFLPPLADAVLRSAGRRRAQALQAGESGYDAKLMGTKTA
jgi:short-subunit dehydrogenase